MAKCYVYRKNIIYLGILLSVGKYFFGFNNLAIIFLLTIEIAISGTVEKSIVILIKLLSHIIYKRIIIFQQICSLKLLYACKYA